MKSLKDLARQAVLDDPVGACNNDDYSIISNNTILRKKPEQMTLFIPRLVSMLETAWAAQMNHPEASFWPFLTMNHAAIPLIKARIADHFENCHRWHTTKTISKLILLRVQHNYED